MFSKNKKQRLIAILTIPIIILAFMIFAPFGSVNPSDVGFYTSIVFGIAVALVTDYLIFKYQRTRKYMKH